MRKRTNQIVQGGIDFFRSTTYNNEITFGNCGGSPASSFDVEAIPDGTEVTLVRGNIRIKAIIRADIGTFECNYNSFGAGSSIARTLRLLDGARYSFVYNSVTKIIQVRRKSVSLERVRVIPDAAYTSSQIGIGDGLKERLGYILPDQTAISVRGGGSRKQLLVRTIRAGEDEMFNYDIRLNPQNFSLFSLGSRPVVLAVSYDQVNRILRFVRRISLRKLLRKTK